jgi:hypothetical protein
MHRWTAARGIATRALSALVVLGGCLLAAVAYAATGPAPGTGTAEELRKLNPKQGGARPSRPLITKHPEKMSTTTTAGFAFEAPRGAPRFQCRLDGGGWKRCRAPVAFKGLVAGEHSFSVRVVSRFGRRGAVARFRWRLFEPKSFSIEPRLSSLDSLFPGAPAQTLPVLLKNPNPVPILVTALRATATADPLGCDSATNLELTPSSASPALPLMVPAEGSVSLPAAGASAPAIALRDLPLNQDACQGAHFPLAFSGEARG